MDEFEDRFAGRSFGFPRRDGARGHRLRIPGKFPDAALDFPIEIPRAVDTRHDFIATVAIYCAPSGPGELELSNLIVRDYDLIYTVAGGQPRRKYTHKAVVTMTNGRIYPFVGDQEVWAVLETDQPQKPSSAGFGAPLTWTFVPALDFTQPRSGALRLWGWN